jgi:hypothetical protein
LTEATLKSLHDVVKAGKARISAPPLRLAVRLRPRHRRAPRLDPLRHHAEPRQPALSRGRNARCCRSVPRKIAVIPMESAGAPPVDPR